MDLSLIVFLIGSAASYFPIYWALNRILGLWQFRQEAKQENSDTGRREEFLNCLRKEAISRVKAILTAASLEGLRDADLPSAALLSRNRARAAQLSEARRLLEPLFSAEMICWFDQLVSEIELCDPARIGQFAAALDHSSVGHVGMLRLAPRLSERRSRDKTALRRHEPVLAFQS